MENPLIDSRAVPVLKLLGITDVTKATIDKKEIVSPIHMKLWQSRGYIVKQTGGVIKVVFGKINPNSYSYPFTVIKRK